MLNDIIKFKIHVQGSLEAYEDFVAQEEQAELDGHMDEMEE
jgi:kinetochore protein NDC80